MGQDEERRTTPDRQVGAGSDTRSIRVHDLAAAGDLEGLRKLLDGSPDAVDARGRMQRTALFAAADRGQIEAARLLLDRGADPHAASDSGDVPLHWAASEPVVSALVDAGANLDRCDELGSSALHWAARRGRLEAARALLRAGANAGAVDHEESTPLHGAESSEIAKLLLESGAPLDHPDRRGRTPLWLALWDKRDDVARVLVDGGADTCSADAGGVTPGQLAQTRECSDGHAIRERLAATHGPPAAPDALDLDGIESAEHLLVAVHPTRPEALSVCRPSTLVRWSLADAARIADATTTAHESIASIDISPDGAMLAVVPDGAQAELRSWAYPSVVAPVPAGHGAALAAFQPAGDLFAIADGDDRLLLWDVRRETIAGAAFVPVGTQTLAFSPDGEQLALGRSAAAGAGVVIFDLEEGRVTNRVDHVLADETTEPSQFVESVPSMAFAPEGGTLALWTTSREPSGPRTDGWVGDIVLLDTYDGSRRWRRTVDDEMLADEVDPLPGEPGRPAPLCFCDAGRLLVVGLPGMVIFLTALDGQVSDVRRTAGSVRDLAVDRRRGDVLVVGDRGLWRVPVPRS